MIHRDIPSLKITFVTYNMVYPLWTMPLPQVVWYTHMLHLWMTMHVGGTHMDVDGGCTTTTWK